MKKIGNRPITEADTDFSKLQKNEIKNEKKKNPKNSGFFFPFFLLLSYFLSYKEVCDYFFYFMNLMNSMLFDIKVLGRWPIISASKIGGRYRYRLLKKIGIC
jgi:hypothetical protein